MKVLVNNKDRYKNVIKVAWDKDFLVITINDGPWTHIVSYPKIAIEEFEVEGC